jgi:dinuclear metal center YbgI/SA1388 family protein
MGTQVKEIIDRLEQSFPRRMAMDWDNPGLQVGRKMAEVRTAAVALDATDTVIEQCVQMGAELLITHHPLLLSGVRQINEESMAGRRILAMAEHGIAHFAMHTNYDTARMGALAADRLGLQERRILEVTGSDGEQEYGIGFAGMLSSAMTAEACCRLANEAFGTTGIRLFGPKDRMVQYIAISPGSGKSMIRPALEIGAELLLTGDIGHHDGLDAADQGLLVADAGHYGIEHIFIDDICRFLHTEFSQITVKALQPEAPFTVV